MLKKSITLLLAMIFTMAVSMTAFAGTVNNKNGIPEDMILLSREVKTFIDDEGNSIEYTIEEYGRPINNNSRGLKQEYEIGYEKTFRFQISNTELGLPSFVVGTPLSQSAKAKLAAIIAEELGERWASSVIPGVNVVSWVTAGIAILNDLKFGNEGFEALVTAKYAGTFIHSQGHYMYGWNPTGLSVRTY